jgi:hypothetical protein
VHRFRTGTRRLQILLGEFSPKLDRSEKKLLKLLGRIRKRAGKVRDLDVQSAALRSLKMPREPRRKTQFINHLIELRGKQEKKLRKRSMPAHRPRDSQATETRGQALQSGSRAAILWLSPKLCSIVLTAPVRRSAKRAAPIPHSQQASSLCGRVCHSLE